MNTFLISGGISSEAVDEIRRLYELNYDEEVEIGCGETELAFGVDPPTFAGIAAVIVGIISLCLTIRRDISDSISKNKWTLGRLKETIDTEMLKLGIVNFRVLEVENFENILGKEEKPCRIHVQVLDTDSSIRVLIFRDGNAYSIRCNHKSLH